MGGVSSRDRGSFMSGAERLKHDRKFRCPVAKGDFWLLHVI